MADEVEMAPVAAAEPPKGDPLAKPAATKVATLKLNPVARNPLAGGAPTVGLKPGLKLPPKPGATVGLKPGLKLPPKPGATVGLKPGLKLPPKPGATVGLKPGLKLPTKPVIHKPGSTIAAAPLPKPVAPSVPKPVEVAKPVEDSKPMAAPKPVEAPKAVEVPKPVEASKAVEVPKPVEAPKPVAVDAQGIGKLPTVEAQAVARDDTQPVVDIPKPMEALKSVTQKLKGMTQEIPQQAILHKTGIVAEGAMSDSQKEAAKHKTARISLSDAMGVAPVKNENAPMKTIRIKRPIDIPGATKPLTPQPPPATATAAASATPTATTAAAPAATPTATITQRKTLKITRPSGAVRPAGKFGIRRPSAATTVTTAPVAAPEAAEGAAPAGEIADIADIPEVPAMTPTPVAAAGGDGPAWLWTISVLVQAAACVAIGALAWFLYQNTQIAYF